MRAEAVNYRLGERDERRSERLEQAANVMTPARRAGLEALERELNEFLQSRPR
jgi:hypothetical protein